MSRRRSNLPPNFGFQPVSAFHAPSAKRHVRSRACVPPMVSTPPSHPSALWNTLLSGSSITTGFQPFSVLRTMVSFAGPGTEVGLPSAPVPSTNCACATRIAGYGPPTSGSRRGVLAEALAGGELAGGFSPPPPPAWRASRTAASSAERGIVASSRVGARLSTNATDGRAIPACRGSPSRSPGSTPRRHAASPLTQFTPRVTPAPSDCRPRSAARCAAATQGCTHARRSHPPLVRPDRGRRRLRRVGFRHQHAHELGAAARLDPGDDLHGAYRRLRLPPPLP